MQQHYVLAAGARRQGLGARVGALWRDPASACAHTSDPLSFYASFDHIDKRINIYIQCNPSKMDVELNTEWDQRTSILSLWNEI